MARPPPPPPEPQAQPQPRPPFIRPALTVRPSAPPQEPSPPPPSTTTSSVPSSPVIRFRPSSSTSSLPNSPVAPRSSPTSTALPVTSSSSIPPSPIQKTSAPSSPPPPLPSPAATKSISTTPASPPPYRPPVTPTTTTVAAPTPPQKILKPLVNTPLPPSPHPPSPLILPPAARIVSTAQQETKTPAETEKKTVHVQETIENHKIMNTHNSKTAKIQGKDKKPSESEDFGKRIITIAGDNTGAVMEVRSSNKKKGSLGIDEGDDERYPFVNSNVQGVNNSILFNSASTHHDPGVHVSLTRRINGGGGGMGTPHKD